MNSNYFIYVAYPTAMQVQKRRMLTSIGLYHTCNDGALSTLPAMYPILKDKLDLVYTDIGIIVSAGLFMTLIFQLVVGRISDRQSPRYLLGGGFAIITIALFLITLITNFVELLLAILIIRLGASFYHPIGISWISRNFHGKDLDHSMGVQSSFGDSGVFLGFMTTGFIAAQFGWQYPFIIWGILTFLAIIFGFAAVRSDSEVVAPLKDSVPLNFDTIRQIFKSIRLYILPFAMGGASYTIGITYGPLLLTDKIQLSEGTVGLIIGGWIGIGIITAYMFSRITKVLGGRYRTLIIAFLLISIMGLIIGWFKYLPILIIGFLVFGGMMFITFPALFTLTTDSTDKRMRGVTFGILFAMQLSGGVIIAYLCGWLADNYGISVPFYILTILGIMTIIWLLTFGKTHNFNPNHSEV
ncbi:MAG: MFS transporter [Thermoplasmata archaeon]|nr:MFS transporter [Thermoplasmata archaeon]